MILVLQNIFFRDESMKELNYNIFVDLSKGLLVHSDSAYESMKFIFFPLS